MTVNLTDSIKFCVTLQDTIQKEPQGSFTSGDLIRTVRGLAQKHQTDLSTSTSAIATLLKQCLGEHPISDRKLLKGIAKIYSHASTLNPTTDEVQKLTALGNAFSNVKDLPQSTRIAIRVAKEVFAQSTKGLKIGATQSGWTHITASVLEFVESCRLLGTKLPREVRDSVEAIYLLITTTPENKKELQDRIIKLTKTLTDLRKTIARWSFDPFTGIGILLEKLLSEMQRGKKKA